MDQLKNFASGSHGNNASNNNNQQEDYLDKGLDSVEKKFGGSMGQDTQKNRAINEKIVSFNPKTVDLFKCDGADNY